jgi:urea carboxylase-associated protein 2
LSNGPEKHEVLAGGQAWSRRMRRRQVMRLRDDAGTACVSALFFNAHDPLERYNMADTLKAQLTAFLTEDRVLYSDMGRVLCSITRDTCGWHDTISGCGDAATSRARYGDGTYQELRNGFHRNARDNFLVELGKHGLGKRDVVANVNFFVRVGVDDEGALRWIPRKAKPGADASVLVELRFEMDTLVVLSNTPHPLDPNPKYGPPAVTISLFEGPAPGPDDPCRISRPENERGFARTEAYVAEQRGAL